MRKAIALLFETASVFCGATADLLDPPPTEGAVTVVIADGEVLKVTRPGEASEPEQN